MTDCIDDGATLYVGDLNLKVTEKTLFEKFKEFGQINSIRVCRDNLSKKSFGYAYVTFYKKSDAQNALNKLNHAVIYGQSCRIMWFEKDFVKRKSGVGNIIIKNLDEFTSINDINEVFGAFGEITSCKLKTDYLGLPTGWAYANYKNEEDAEDAIEVMNQKEFGNNVITVEKYITKSSTSKDNLKNCYVDNCSAFVDDNFLRLIFERYGVVITANIMYNKDGISKGFGFVRFKESTDAATATKNLNGQIIHNSKIHVYRINLKKEVANTNLYINNLSKNIDEKMLKNEFQLFGKISGIKVMRHPQTNKSYGYGFVSFYDQDSATKAIKEMNGKVIDGKELFVTYNKTNVLNHQSQTLEPIINASVNNEIKPRHNVPFFPLSLLNQGFQFMEPSRFCFPEFNLYNMNNISLSTNNASTISKQMLGDRIYSLVFEYAGYNSIDVTKRLLHLDNYKILKLIENVDLLKVEVQQILDDLYKESLLNANNARELSTNHEVENIDIASSEGSVQESSSEDKNVTEDIEYFSGEDDCLEYKESLGCKIYPLVENISGNMVKDIISLFLKLSKAELLYMIENEEFLKMKITEAEKELLTTKNNECDDLNLPTDYNNEKNELDNVLNNKDIKKILKDMICQIAIQHSWVLSEEIHDLLLGLDDKELEYMTKNEDYLITRIEDSMNKVQRNNEEDTNTFTVDHYKLNENDDLPNYFQPVNNTIQSGMWRFMQPLTDHSNSVVNNQQRNIMSNFMFPQINFQRQMFQRPVFNLRSIPPYNISFPVQPQSFINFNQSLRMNQTPNSNNTQQALGQHLFNIIIKHTMDINIARQITFIFLAYDKNVLFNIMNNENLLKMKIAETMTCLNLSTTQEPFEKKSEIILQKESKEDLLSDVNDDLTPNLARQEGKHLKKNEKVNIETKTYISGFGFN